MGGSGVARFHGTYPSPGPADKGDSGPDEDDGEKDGGSNCRGHGLSFCKASSFWPTLAPDSNDVEPVMNSH
jgi:hypothetical protein